MILLYLSFPLLNYLLKKHELGVCCIACLVFALAINSKMLGQDEFRNIFSCAISFLGGMEIAKYRLFENQFIICASMVITGVISYCPVSMNFNLLCHVAGSALFFSLFGLGKYLMKNRKISLVVKKVSAVSYEIFLWQHIIIFAVVKRINPSDTILSVLLMLSVLTMVYIGSCVVSKFVRVLENSAFIRNIDKFMMKKVQGNNRALFSEETTKKIMAHIKQLEEEN